MGLGGDSAVGGWLRLWEGREGKREENEGEERMGKRERRKGVEREREEDGEGESKEKREGEKGTKGRKRGRGRDGESILFPFGLVLAFSDLSFQRAYGSFSSIQSCCPSATEPSKALRCLQDKRLSLL